MSWTLLDDDIKLSLLNALAMTFLVPLMCSIMGPNSYFKRCHLITCSVLKFLYVRFLWSVQTTICCPKRIFLNSLSVLTIDNNSRSMVVYCV